MKAILGIILILILGVIYFCTIYNSEKFTTSTDCNKTLTKCVNGKCINCPNNFECVTVEQEDNYIFNGGKVPVGQYCLPKKGNKACNRYTGRWVWTADGDQTWKCECLYPRLFGNNDSTSDCTVKYACNNPTHPDTDDPTDPKIGNKLIGTKFAPKNLQGQIWDPAYQEKTEVLMVNPYTTDKDGNPYFDCQCNSKTSGVAMSALPDSPYMCHVDQCWLGNKINSIVAQPDGTVQCDCASGGTGSENIPEGKLAGACFNASTVCGGGSWDKDKKMCICQSKGASTVGCPVKCGSKQYGLTGDKDADGNEIMCETNPAGRMCYNMCQDKEPCQNGGKCSPSCDGGKIDYSCLCVTDPATHKQYKGKNCDTFCYTKGFQFGSSVCTPPSGPGIPPTCWCGGDYTACCNGEDVQPLSGPGMPCYCA